MTTTPQPLTTPSATDRPTAHDHHHADHHPVHHLPVHHLPAGDLDGLAVRGRIVTPRDADWDAVRAPWNVLVDQRPLAVVLAADADDVVATVRHAVHHDLTVTAQGPGHGASSALDRTVLIRTSALDDLWIDAEARVARVGAGVHWSRLQRALDGSGLTGLAGSSGEISVVGFSLAGGMSWFSRAYGSGAGALRAVELVDPTGRHRWVSDSSDPELMWALRGGGGDLGIVTAVEIDLFPAQEIHGGTIAFPGVVAPQVLRAYRDATAVAPRETTLWAAILHLPDIEAIPEPMRGQSLTVVQAMHLGGRPALDALLTGVRAAGPVLRDDIRPVSAAAVGSVAEDPEEPSPSMLSATRLSTLDDDTIDALVGVVGVGSGTPLLQVQLRHLGGALAQPGAPAVAGPVDDAYLISAPAMVPAPELVPVMSGGLDAVLAALEPWSTGTAPLTFLDRDETVAKAYPTGAERLRRLKVERDPRGVIRSNRPLLAGA